jgi:cell division protein FtsA
MSKETKRDLIVGLDIGTSKIVAIVGELTPRAGWKSSASAAQESRGLKKRRGGQHRGHGEFDLARHPGSRADGRLQGAEVYTGIAGSHIKSFNSNGMVAIKDKEVTPADVERVIEAANAMPIPSDQQILHILTQEFIVDGQDGVASRSA